MFTISRIRLAMQKTVILDAFASAALSNSQVRRSGSASDHFQKYRVQQVYSKFNHQLQLESLKSPKLLSEHELTPFFRGEVTSVSDLFSVCKVLHKIKELEQDKDAELRYKGRGFKLPKHMRYWFRGHCNSEYELIPNLFRHHNLSGKEDLMIKEFLLRNPQPIGTDHFHVLATMQHYGYVTRLLDWTSCMMNAAYFACLDTNSNDSDGMIWILEPYRLSISNRISEALAGIALVEDFDAQIRALQSLAFNFSELRSDYSKNLFNAKHLPGTTKIEAGHIGFEKFIEKLDAIMQTEEAGKLLRPIAVDPGHINDRITAQRGKFTISGGKVYEGEYDCQDQNEKGLFFSRPRFLAENDEDLNGMYISNLIIPKEHKATIRAELELILGIDIESFMLDLNSKAEMAARRLSG